MFKTTPSRAQAPLAQPTPLILPGPTAGSYKMSSPGESGRIYTLQTSTALLTWNYLDLVKLGVTGTSIEYGFTPMSGGRSFFRMKYTVATTYTAGREGDIDGDGLTN